MAEGKKLGIALVLGCGGLLAAFLVFAAVLVFIIMGALKSNDAYRGAMERARANQEVVAVVGEPIEEGFLMTGNVSVSGASGEASIGIPISGPKGEGTIYVEATKSAGQWNYRQLVFEAEGGQRIDLLAE